MTERVDISSARGRLKELAGRAASGEQIVLTRYNRATARIVGLDEDRFLERLHFWLTVHHERCSLMAHNADELFAILREDEE